MTSNFPDSGPDMKYDMIKELFKKVEDTNEAVEEIKTALVGDLKTRTPGLQDTVRELGIDVSNIRSDMTTRRGANLREHKIMKGGIFVVGILALIGMMVGLEDHVQIVGGLIKLIVKILT